MDGLVNTQLILNTSFGQMTLIRISLECPVCHKQWGIKEHSLEELNADLEKGDKFICFNCRFGDRSLLSQE